jgi:hypothetical protein
MDSLPVDPMVVEKATRRHFLPESLPIGNIQNRGNEERSRLRRLHHGKSGGLHGAKGGGPVLLLGRMPREIQEIGPVKTRETPHPSPVDKGDIIKKKTRKK